MSGMTFSTALHSTWLLSSFSLSYSGLPLSRSAFRPNVQKMTIYTSDKVDIEQAYCTNILIGKNGDDIYHSVASLYSGRAPLQVCAWGEQLSAALHC